MGNDGHYGQHLTQLSSTQRPEDLDSINSIALNRGFGSPGCSKIHRLFKIQLMGDIYRDLNRILAHSHRIEQVAIALPG